MRTRGSSAPTLAFALALILLATTGVSTHRRDEYLQAARIGVEPDGIQIDLDLTPGIDVAQSIISKIDQDGDESLSGDERRAYTGQVLEALQITLDGVPRRLDLTSSIFPETSALRSGEGTIRLQAGVSHHRLSSGRHQIVFRNAHLDGESAYLANALVPKSARVSVTGQRRDSRQRELTIDYTVRAESATVSGWLLVGVPLALLLVVRATRAWRNVR